MKISTKLVVLFGLLIGSVSANAVEMSTTIGLGSDYFWRGVSQNAGNAAFSAGTELSTEDGFYVGVWGSQVDFGDDASYEYDFYGGYNVDLTDNVSVGVGAVRYMYDQGYEATEEVFVTGSYRGLDVAYYRNPDESDLDYFSVSSVLPGISVVDVAVQYGQFGDGTSHKGVTLSKSLTDKIDVSLLVRSTVRSNQFWDNAAASISYTF
ncbi:MAG: hypothetical protein CMN34_05815 [Saprospirales bacterium]|nr:hypothetical protein [Saprospirales bacterium]|tara:strand:- start:1078 stop:1701 length:624 start_codon:yes stop_codon:yes gene_type:complete